MASGKATTWKTGMLNAFFCNTTFQSAGAADVIRGAASAGNLELSLHTGSAIGAGSAQNTSETAYTGYARVAVPRTSSDWTVATNQSKNTNLLNFGACTASPGANLTDLGIGTDHTGAGKLCYFGTLTNAIAMSVGITPQLAALALVVQED
jgi:hypothetical protein